MNWPRSVPRFHSFTEPTIEEAFGGGRLINNRYSIDPDKLLGQGTKTYRGIDSKTGNFVAVKFESVMTRHPHLQLEIPIYHDLRDCPGVPKVHWSGVEFRYHILVVDLLEASFTQLFNYCGKQFSLKTTLMIGIQMIERIEMLHKKGYLHRDIKPDNFMIGVDDYKKRVYIIDFGMAQRYPVPYVVDQSMDQSIVGTANFISVNAHLGLQQTRRDDLESLAFMLVYFLKGSLPWSDVKIKKPAHYFQCISVIKRKTPFERLCEDLPEEFRLFFEHVRSLSFNQEPDYTYLKRLFTKCLGRFAYVHDYHYDWDIKREMAQNVAMEKAVEKKLNVNN